MGPLAWYVPDLCQVLFWYHALMQKQKPERPDLAEASVPDCGIAFIVAVWDLRMLLVVMKTGSCCTLSDIACARHDKHSYENCHRI